MTEMGIHFGYRQGSKAPDPKVEEPAPAEPRAVPPKIANYYYLACFNTLHHRRWHVVATQTREPASRSVSYTTCAVLGSFAALEA